MFLTNLTLKRPVFATVTILALVVLGMFSYFGLNINDWPEIEFPYVTITIVQPGASPEQMESKVVLKLEEAVGQVAGVKHIYASTQEGIALLWVEFTLETDPQIASQDIRDKLGSIRGDLPQEIEEPIISRFDPSAAPIVTLAVTGDKPVRELSQLVDDLVKRRLETIGGVGAVNVSGSEKREIQILLDKEKLAAYGLSPSEVVSSLRQENLDLPGGNLTGPDRKITLSTAGEVKRLEDFNRLPVARRGAVQLYLRDVATVVDGAKERESVARYQGRPVVGLDIIKQSGTNTVQIADQVKQAVEEINQELPPGVSLEMVRDNSVDIRSSVNNVTMTMIEGSILAVLTVFIFLRNWRSTIISAVSLPTSIITTFLVMKVMGFTLNTMTLMALSLSVGLLIDDAIVVIENIVRHLQQGKPPLQAAREATEEIGLAVMATTLTVVAVFIPMGMMKGEVGRFFVQFGISVVFSLFISLLVSFTLVPLLSSRYLNQEEQLPGGGLGRFLEWFNRGFERLKGAYLRLLEWVLSNRWKTIGSAFALFAASLVIMPLLGSGFIPTSDMGGFSLVAQMDSGMSLKAAEKVTQRMEQEIGGCPEVSGIYSSTSTEETRFFIKTVDKADRNKSIFEVGNDIRQRLNTIPGVKVQLLYNTGLMEERAWQFRLKGEDQEKMQVYAEQAQRILESIPGAVDITSSNKPGKPETKLVIKRDRAADLGVSTGLIAETIYTMFNGTVVGQFEEKDDQYDIRVRLSGDQRENLNDLDRIYLPSSNDSQPQVALSQVAETVFTTASSDIERFDRSREIVLSGNMVGTSVGNLIDTFTERAGKEIELPPGYEIYAGGDAERMAESFSSLYTALVLGILFIFFILAAQFESYIDPFSIMLSLPLAVIGAILGLLVMGSELSLVSMIGVIFLMGLVTKNAILLIDFTRQARASGMERNSALMQAAAIRLRPILMTSTAMVLGMIPMALALGSGAELRSPMAHAVIGGLITSTLLTLVVVPVVYTFLDDLKNRFSLRGKTVSDHAAAESKTLDS